MNLKKKSKLISTLEFCKLNVSSVAAYGGRNVIYALIDGHLHIFLRVARIWSPPETREASDSSLDLQGASDSLPG